MPAPQFMSNLRTAPGDVPDEQENNAVHDYKKIMEDISREHPHLSTGAMQQLALERRAKMIAERGEKSDKRPSDFLRGMMSKLRIGKNQSDDGFDPATGKDELGSTIGSLSLEPDLVPSKRRSLAVRQSVKCICSEDRIETSDIEEEISLQDSLENIEKTFRRSNRRSVNDSCRYSRRYSGISLELSDVEEDEHPEPSAKDGADLDASFSLKDKSNPSAQNNHHLHQSISDVLPSEIKLVLDDYRAGKKKCSSPGRRQKRDSRRQSDESGNSLSIVSIESANFKGDFSAWNSFRGGRST